MAISLIDGLSITEDKRQSFTIKYVKYNDAKKTGGQIIELPRAYRGGSAYKLEKQDMISVIQDGRSYPVHTHLILEINKQAIYL